MYIDRIVTKKIRNSRKEVAIEVSVYSKGKKFKTSAPSGKSLGRHEVSAFSCKGIDHSIFLIKKISSLIQKINFQKFEDLIYIEEIVKKVDSSPNLKFFGGNPLFALEASVLKALAFSQEKELWQFIASKTKIPRPLGNCIGGGLHSNQKIKPEFQEFLLLPNEDNFSDNYAVNYRVYQDLKKKLRSNTSSVSDERAIAITYPNEKVFQILLEEKKKIQNKFKHSFNIGTDVAANSFYKNGYYVYKDKKLSRKKQIEYIVYLIKKYNLKYVEDPLMEEDFKGFAEILKKVRNRCLICGDDLIVTNVERLKKAIKVKAVNAIIVKPNQIGSLLKTKAIVDLAKKKKIVPVISHRSGETLDNTISHLAVGWGIPIIKTGITGPERNAKLKEIIRIESNHNNT